MNADEQMERLVNSWMEDTAPASLPTRVLDATFERTRESRQQVGWRGRIERIHVARSVLAGGAAVLIVAAVAMSPRVVRPLVGELPTVSAAWSRISIEAGPDAEGVISLAAGPDGLLAIVRAGDGPARLLASPDGERWTRVPDDRLPAPLVQGLFGSPAAQTGATVVGTDQGFLMIGDGVWASDDGTTWRSLASPANDPDLRTGRMRSVARGGPGYVAVGSDNRAWYSTDGSDWSLAEVPPPPNEFFERRGFAAPTVDMGGVAVSGNHLVAWGAASRHTADAGMNVPVLWASDDGRTWANVLEPEDSDDLAAVAVGPDGAFVAINKVRDAAADEQRVLVSRSADGRDWEPVDDLGPAWTKATDGDTPVRLAVSALAASSAGFVAAGGLDPVCGFDPCLTGEAAVWTSADGRSWSRLATDDRFGAGVSDVVAWGDRFVMAGAYGGRPVIWISDAPAPSR